MKLTLLCSVLFLILAGCAKKQPAENAVKIANYELEKSGSPYRLSVINHPQGLSEVKKELVGTPVSTMATPQLADDIKLYLEKKERDSGSNSKLKVHEIRLISKNMSLVKEIWIVDRNEEEVAYTINLIPTPDKGGTDVKINGPW